LVHHRRDWRPGRENEGNAPEACSVLAAAGAGNRGAIDVAQRRHGRRHQRCAHTLRDQPSMPVSNGLGLFETHALGNRMQISFGSTGAATKLLCGGVTFERGASNPLLAILAPVLHIGRAGDRARSWVGLTTQHILAELDSAAKGADELVTPLAGILLIQAVRTYFEENAETIDYRWLASVRDRQIGQALVILHREPRRPWTVISGAPVSDVPPRPSRRDSRNCLASRRTVTSRVFASTRPQSSSELPIGS
jgi:hypothetical protein